MIKRLKIEKVTATGQTDNYGNPKSIVKVWNDSNFYVSASKKILDYEGKEVDLEVQELKGKDSGKVYFKLKFPPKEDQTQQTLPTAAPKQSYQRNEDLIDRKVAFNGLIELIASNAMNIDDLSVLNVDLFSDMIKGERHEQTHAPEIGRIDTTVNKDEVPLSVREEQAEATTDQIDLEDIPF